MYIVKKINLRQISKFTMMFAMIFSAVPTIVITSIIIYENLFSSRFTFFEDLIIPVLFAIAIILFFGVGGLLVGAVTSFIYNKEAEKGHYFILNMEQIEDESVDVENRS